MASSLLNIQPENDYHRFAITPTEDDKSYYQHVIISRGKKSDLNLNDKIDGPGEYVSTYIRCSWVAVMDRIKAKKTVHDSVKDTIDIENNFSGFLFVKVDNEKHGGFLIEYKLNGEIVLHQVSNGEHTLDNVTLHFIAQETPFTSQDKKPIITTVDAETFTGCKLTIDPGGVVPVIDLDNSTKLKKKRIDRTTLTDSPLVIFFIDRQNSIIIFEIEKIDIAKIKNRGGIIYPDSIGSANQTGNSRQNKVTTNVLGTRIVGTFFQWRTIINGLNIEKHTFEGAKRQSLLILPKVTIGNLPESIFLTGCRNVDNIQDHLPTTFIYLTRVLAKRRRDDAKSNRLRAHSIFDKILHFVNFIIFIDYIGFGGNITIDDLLDVTRPINWNRDNSILISDKINKIDVIKKPSNKPDDYSVLVYLSKENQASVYYTFPISLWKQILGRKASAPMVTLRLDDEITSTLPACIAFYPYTKDKMKQKDIMVRFTYDVRKVDKDCMLVIESSPSQYDHIKRQLEKILQKCSGIKYMNDSGKETSITSLSVFGDRVLYSNECSFSCRFTEPTPDMKPVYPPGYVSKPIPDGPTNVISAVRKRAISSSDDTTEARKQMRSSSSGGDNAAAADELDGDGDDDDGMYDSDTDRAILKMFGSTHDDEYTGASGAVAVADYADAGAVVDYAGYADDADADDLLKMTFDDFYDVSDDDDNDDKASKNNN